METVKEREPRHLSLVPEPEETPDVSKLYLEEIKNIPLLTALDEQRLFIRKRGGEDAKRRLTENHNLSDQERENLVSLIQEGEEAREELINSNQRLVISVAKGYLGSGIPFLDLVQEGNIGLMEAIRRFDPERGFRLSTYATWWIRQAVARGVSSQSRNIRLPIHQGERISKLNRVSQELEQDLGRKPTLEKLAEALDMEVGKVENLLKISQKTISLEEPVGKDGETTLEQFIEDKKSPMPDSQAEKILLEEKVDETLADLTPRQIQILRMRFGFMDGHNWTLKEIGEKFGLTRERIRQLEEEALRKLRHPSRARKLEDFY